MIARSLNIDENSSQAVVRTEWEAQGNVWGEWGDMVTTRGGPANSHTPGRRADPDPAAMQALRKLSGRKRQPYSTNEIKDEMAAMSQQKPTQTLYLRAYQQLKKLMDNDAIIRIEKDWALPDISHDALIEDQIEDLI